ncbi:MAG: hypothetical protein ACE14L_01770 [Terriglobales bacterium]
MKLRLATLLLMLMLSAVPAWAQGCAMCISSAAASGKQGQRAINRGVLVLLAPPVAFMTVGVGLAFSYSKKRDRDGDEMPVPTEEE